MKQVINSLMHNVAREPGGVVAELIKYGTEKLRPKNVRLSPNNGNK